MSVAWSDSPFLQLGLALQPGLAVSDQEDPASNPMREAITSALMCNSQKSVVSLIECPMHLHSYFK